VTTAHEPRRGPGIHLSVDDLSALAEGAQPTAEGASEHLADCAVCRSEVDAIAQLLAAFETLEPPRLPQEVAIRIDAALAREAAARASVPHAGAAAEPVPAAAKSSGSRRRWWLSRRVGLGLASLAALVGGVTLAINLVSSSSTESGSAASGAAAQPYASDKGAPMRAQGKADTAGPVDPTSPLAVWVKQVLGGNHPAQLELYSPCETDPVYATQQPLRVVNGSFKGVSSTLVVYPNEGDPATVRAVVYAQPCTPTSYQVLAQGIVAK
jgi:hypothetical protein